MNNTPLSEKLLNDVEDLKYNIEELKYNVATETVRGESLNITDSANARIRDIKLYGAIQQDGEPALDEPINVEVVTGDVTVKLDNGDGTEKSVTLNLSNLELCGNDTCGRDYLYRKAGKWYKCCAWSKIILNGLESHWVLYTSNENYTRFYTTSSLGTDNGGDGTTINCLCDKLIATKFFGGLNNLNNNCISSMNYLNEHRFDICLANDLASSVTGLRTFLANNNLTVYYQLDTEIDEEITDETLLTQLEQLYNSTTYKTTTNVTTETDNLSPTLELEYVLDLKTYIDNKISALST